MTENRFSSGDESDVQGEQQPDPLSRYSPPVKKALLVSVIVVGLVMGLFCAYLLMELISAFTGPRLKPPELEKPDRTVTMASPKASTSPRTPKHSGSTKTPRPTTSPTPAPEVILDMPSQYYRISDLLDGGLALYEQARYREAEHEFRKALAVDRRCSEAHLYVGQCREMQKDPGGALEEYWRFLRCEPKNPERLLSIARFLEEEKQYGKTIGIYKVILGEHPGADECYLIADCYARNKNNEKAIYYLKYALVYQKNHYPSLLLLGQCYRRSSMPGEAWNAYKAAYRLNRKNVPLLYEMGEICCELGRYQYAKKYLQEYQTREGDPELRKKGFDLLKTAMYRAQQKIPPSVESQNDEIPGISIVRMLKADEGWHALMSLNSRDEEIEEGNTVLNKYYVLDINESRVVLKFEDAYFVLRPR